MSIKQISTWVRNTGTLATLVATSTTIAGILAPTASATGLTTIPLTLPPEGEIDVGLGCLDPAKCVAPHDLIESIESLVDSTTGSKSRLFMDNLLTENIYTDPVTGETVILLDGDRGTNPEGYWFRPSTDEEEGRLEVGTYKFTFAQTLTELDFTFYDAERWRQTGVVAINGEEVNQFYRGHGNNGQTTETFLNVDSITLKLGVDFPEEDRSGDGVDFQLVARLPVDVPEPSTVLGLGAVAAMGALGLRKRKSSK